jgi:hypothetical protein
MKKTKAVLTGIDGVRAELKTLRKMHNNKYMCTFTVTDKDGNTMSGPHLGRNYRVIHGPCHADLQKYHPGSAYVLNVFPERLIPEATKAKAYIRWLMHESMYQEVFRPDLQTVSEVYSTRGTTQLMGGACIATRTYHEFPEYINLWYRLSKSGIAPNLAYLLCHMFVSYDRYQGGQGGQAGLGAFSYASMGFGGHKSFSSGCLSINEGIPNFLSGKYNKGEPYSKNVIYYGIDVSWQNGHPKECYGKTLVGLYGDFFKAVLKAPKLWGAGAGPVSTPTKTRFTYRDVLKIARLEQARMGLA